MVFIDKPISKECFKQRCSSAFVDSIVIHSSSTIEKTPQDPFNIDTLISIYEQHGVSAHYLIDREGEIFSLVPNKACAFHAGKGILPWFPERENTLNEYSIGIELLSVGTWDEMSIHALSKETYETIPQKDIGYTEAQYTSLNKLIDHLCTVFPEINKTRKHIVGHDEYAPERKTDPGSLFDWSKVNLLG